jgi:DnaJ-class molecular chaperone
VTYHPDRQEPQLREEAKEKFTLIKTAYETLIDDRLRLIYDRFGVQGLKTGVELATKYKTSEEVTIEICIPNIMHRFSTNLRKFNSKMNEQK